tara:strand:- start:359 stop:532 length:174 start_codon:yes stop_codon:yes gene_type:complete
METLFITGNSRFIKDLNDKVANAEAQGFVVQETFVVQGTSFTKYESGAEIVVRMQKF